MDEEKKRKLLRVFHLKVFSDTGNENLKNYNIDEKLR